MGIAADITLIVVGSLIGGILARLLRQPPLLGYILAGTILGPYVLGVINDVEEIELLAEIGVSLLMFALGLQLRLKDLAPVRRVAIYGTALQMLLTIAFGVGVGLWFGWPWLTGVWFGALVSLSSTVVILKVLQGRGLLGTLSSRVIIGVMIAQDLAVIPLMVILPQLNDLSTGLPQLGFAILRAAAFLAGMLLLGTRLIPRLLRVAADWNSRELFLVSVTAIALGVGYLTYLAGLSFAFGAFVAGIVISESDYSIQALGDVIPLRDLFSLLFFASVGMLLSPVFIWENLGMVLLLVLVASVGKALILGGVARLFGYVNIVPLAIGLTMFQVGEFSFVLAGVGMASGAIDADFYALILSVAVVSIMLTPPISALIEPLYNIQRQVTGGQTAPVIANLPSEGLRDHVIVAGGGHAGHYVARVLQQMGMSFVVIDMNPERVDKLKALGVPVIFGDAGHPIVLEAAQIRTACVLIDTVPDIQASEAILDYIHVTGKSLHVVARAENEAEIDMLVANGVYEVVMPQFEAGLELVRQALKHLQVDNRQIANYIEDCRLSLYQPMRQLEVPVDVPMDAAIEVPAVKDDENDTAVEAL